MLTPPVGRIIDTSNQLCGYSPSDTVASDCGQSATWHVVWDVTLENGLSCEAHMANIQQRFVYLYRHPVGPDCAQDGAIWLVNEGRCARPEATASEVAEARIAPAELASRPA